MADGAPSGANEFIEDSLTKLAEGLENALNMDVFTYSGQLLYGVDDLTRDVIESRNKRRDNLAVVLETTGGFIEPARRMVNVFRKNYPKGRVEFIIPSYAMSAGTVLAMSGDAIHMDYYSVLGPIDPQVENKDGDLVPALGYLVKYDRLLKKAANGKASSAEIAILLNFDQAELYRYEQDRELSIQLLKEWLTKYKFKDWLVTQTKKQPVDNAMREKRATEVARILNQTDKWHSHGHGITMEVLRRDLNLVIDDFGDPAKGDLSDKIRAYHRLLVDYMGRTRRQICVHAPNKLIYM